MTSSSSISNPSEPAPQSAPPPSSTLTTPPVIKALSESVINRIAAGEVIHRPSNALKELLENSLDAQSTRLSLTLKDGGLRLIQITDNGCGIRRADLPILCRRFTTSKITAYDDLQRIDTFGFRGEALASITHVARTSVITMTRDSPCAYRAYYSDGELCAPRPGESNQPRACAGVPGTTIIVEDLFYNVPIRRAALKSPSDEYAQCVDVVTKYAIHYSGIAFTCKKAGSAIADINTVSSSSTLDNIRSLYGPLIAKELIPFSASSPRHHLRCSGYLSNLNFSVKRQTFILFVNGRLVDSTAVKQVVQGVYGRHLPKHAHGWCYLSVEVAKDEVDVNVHPTKREVSLLYEDELLEMVERGMDEALKGTENSRVFYAIPIVTAKNGGMEMEETKEGGESEERGDEEEKEAGEGMEEEEEELVSFTQIGREKRFYRPHKLVRTDARQGKLASFFNQPTTTSSSSPSSASSPPPHSTSLSRKRSRTATTELTSVHRLLTACSSAEGTGLADLFNAHTFVGIVNGTFSLLQHKTNLYLINHIRVSEHLIYQRLLQSFSTHSQMSLDPPVDCQEMIDLLPPSSSPPSIDLLKRFAPMLKEYFSLSITEDGMLTGIPDLLPHYTPPLIAIPLFLRSLCVDVQWTEEESCLQGVTRAIARWYRVQPGMYVEEEEGEEEEKDEKGGAEKCKDGLGKHVRWCIEHSLFPACRQGFSPPQSFLSDGTITQIASLENLYKIFERC